MAKYPVTPRHRPNRLMTQENRLDRFITKAIYWSEGYLVREDRATGRSAYFGLYPSDNGAGYMELKKPHSRARDAVQYVEDFAERKKSLENAEAKTEDSD